LQVKPEAHLDLSHQQTVQVQPTLEQQRIAEASDAIYMRTYGGKGTVGESWAANYSALKMAGINAPHGNAADIKNIPGMTKLDRHEPLQTGDVVIIDKGLDGRMPFGGSFIVSAEGKAMSDHIAKIPDLEKYKQDVTIFRMVPPVTPPLYPHEPISKAEIKEWDIIHTH
jgi:hypothetical protein